MCIKWDSNMNWSTLKNNKNIIFQNKYVGSTMFCVDQICGIYIELVGGKKSHLLTFPKICKDKHLFKCKFDIWH